jgi:hypothetical protein
VSAVGAQEMRRRLPFHVLIVGVAAPSRQQPKVFTAALVPMF